MSEMQREAFLLSNLPNFKRIDGPLTPPGPDYVKSHGDASPGSAFNYSVQGYFTNEGQSSWYDQIKSGGLTGYMVFTEARKLTYGSLPSLKIGDTVRAEGMDETTLYVLAFGRNHSNGLVVQVAGIEREKVEKLHAFAVNRFMVLLEQKVENPAENARRDTALQAEKMGIPCEDHPILASFVSRNREVLPSQ